MTRGKPGCLVVLKAPIRVECTVNGQGPPPESRDIQTDGRVNVEVSSTPFVEWLSTSTCFVIHSTSIRVYNYVALYQKGSHHIHHMAFHDLL